NTGQWLLLLLAHLAAFFFTALMCHQRLAARRPAPDRLTEFYLLLSLGGVVGGAFNALIAPTIFNVVWEYPLVMVLVGLARPWGEGPLSRQDILILLLGIGIAAAPPIILEFMRYNPDFRALLSDQARLQMVQVILGGASICAFLVRD
ncbi:hypothetical protein, partial [Salmonella enterica]|uniref:hypothetical protein n=1 Tax=Salmonella enterica TaxID=28901 RepID=UPI000D570DA7